jgi:hypothetical protein
MPTLFAEAFAEALLHPEQLRPEYRYDEDLGLSVLPDGRVFVEHAGAGETQTVTKATGEQDDRDEETTVTEADGETDTWRTVMEATHTAVDAEADDWAVPPRLDTNTRVRGEADDWAQ